MIVKRYFPAMSIGVFWDVRGWSEKSVVQLLVLRPRYSLFYWLMECNMKCGNGILPNYGGISNMTLAFYCCFKLCIIWLTRSNFGNIRRFTFNCPSWYSSLTLILIVVVKLSRQMGLFPVRLFCLSGNCKAASLEISRRQCHQIESLGRWWYCWLTMSILILRLKCQLNAPAEAGV